jgi:hypothetical protein
LATSVLVGEVGCLIIALGIVPPPVVVAGNLATHVVVIGRGTLPVVTLIATLGRPSPVLFFELGRRRIRSSLVALVSAATLGSRVYDRTLIWGPRLLLLVSRLDTRASLPALSLRLMSCFFSISSILGLLLSLFLFSFKVSCTLPRLATPSPLLRICLFFCGGLILSRGLLVVVARPP